jgi:hypothetical protein
VSFLIELGRHEDMEGEGGKRKCPEPFGKISLSENLEFP